MAKYTNTIEYKLKTTIDNTGLTQLKAQLKNVQGEFQKLAIKNPFKEDMADDAIRSINKIHKAYENAFDPTTGILNLNKLQKSINGISLAKLQQQFSYLGVESRNTFTSMIGSFAKVQTGIKTMSASMDKMINTLGNTARWGISASLIQTMSNRLYDAVQYVKDLDRSLNDIRIVTGLSAENMRDFTFQANEAAKALGQTTVGFTDASLIFAQQGYSLKASADLAALTLKTANVTGQETAEVSEQLTSLLNGFKINGNDIAAATAAVDKLAKVAAVGAADLEELATAESKVASTANTLGVSQDQLVAQLSTIISVTRQAPENVGNAMKTIYARLGDLKMGETLEDGTDLGQIGVTLDKIGISLLDTTGNMRNMGEVIEELMNKWDGLNTAEKQAVAIKLAGKYQYNNLLALLENAEMYNEQLQASYDSLGTINEQQKVYMESLEGKTQALTSAFEGLISTIVDPDAFKPVIESITDLVTLIDQFVNSIGGIGPAFGAAFSMFMTKGSNSLGRKVSGALYNESVEFQMRQNENAVMSTMLNEYGLGKDDVGVASTVDYIRKNSRYLGIMDEAQREQYNADIDARVYAAQEHAAVEHEKKKAEEQIAMFLRGGGISLDEFRDKKGLKLPNLDRLFSIDPDSFDTTKQENFDLVIGQAKKIRDKTSNILQNMFPAEGESTLTFDKWKQHSNDISNIIHTMSTSEKELSKFKKYMDIVEKGLETGQTNTRAYSFALDKLNKGLVEFNRRSSETAKADPTDVIKMATQASNKYEASLQRIKDLDAESTARAYNMALQQQASGLFQVVGAASSLFVALQSLTNLGSIWTNEDLDIGEKIAKTFENIVFVLPMLISGIMEMKEGLNDLTKSAITQQALVQSGNRAVAVEGIFGTSLWAKGSKKKNRRQGQGTNNQERKNQNQEEDDIEVEVMSFFSYVITKVLSTAAKWLPRFFNPATIAIAIVGAIVGVANAAAEKSAEQIQKQNWDRLVEESDEAAEKAKSMRSSADSISALYDEFKETGKASNEFISVLREVGNEIGIQGTDALIASGSFDELARQINAAADAAENTSRELNEQRLAEAKRILDTTEFDTDLSLSWWDRTLINAQVVAQDIYNVFSSIYEWLCEIVDRVAKFFGFKGGREDASTVGGGTASSLAGQYEAESKRVKEHNEEASVSLDASSKALLAAAEGDWAEARENASVAEETAERAKEYANTSEGSSVESQEAATSAETAAKNAKGILDAMIANDRAQKVNDYTNTDTDYNSAVAAALSGNSESAEKALTLLLQTLQGMQAQYGEGDITFNIGGTEYSVDKIIENIGNFTQDELTQLYNSLMFDFSINPSNLSWFDQLIPKESTNQPQEQSGENPIITWLKDFFTSKGGAQGKYGIAAEIASNSIEEDAEVELPDPPTDVVDWYDDPNTIVVHNNRGEMIGWMNQETGRAILIDPNDPSKRTSVSIADQKFSQWYSEMFASEPSVSDGSTAYWPNQDQLPAGSFQYSGKDQYDQRVAEIEAEAAMGMQAAQNELIRQLLGNNGYVINPQTGQPIPIAGAENWEPVAEQLLLDNQFSNYADQKLSQLDEIDFGGQLGQFSYVTDDNGFVVAVVDNWTGKAVLVWDAGLKSYINVYQKRDLAAANSKLGQGYSSIIPEMEDKYIVFPEEAASMDQAELLQMVANKSGVILTPEQLLQNQIEHWMRGGSYPTGPYTGVDNYAEISDMEEAVYTSVQSASELAEESEQLIPFIQDMFNIFGVVYENSAKVRSIDEEFARQINFQLSDGTEFSGEEFFALTNKKQNEYITSIMSDQELFSSFQQGFAQSLIDYAEIVFGSPDIAAQFLGNVLVKSSASGIGVTDDGVVVQPMSHRTPLGGEGTAQPPVATMSEDTQEHQVVLAAAPEVEIFDELMQMHWAPDGDQQQKFMGKWFEAFLGSEFAENKNYSQYKDYVGGGKVFEPKDVTDYIGFFNMLSDFDLYLRERMEIEGIEDDIYLNSFLSNIGTIITDGLYGEDMKNVRSALYTVAMDEAQSAEYDASNGGEAMVEAILEANPNLAAYYDNELSGDILRLIDILQIYVDNEDARKELALYEQQELQRKESENSNEADELIKYLASSGISTETQTGLLAYADASISSKSLQKYVEAGLGWGLSEEELLAIIPYIDLRTQDASTINGINDQIDELNESGQLASIRTNLILSTYQESSDQLRTAMMEDKAGKDEIRPFASEPLQVAFDSAGGQSESLGDVYSLLGNDFDDQMSSLAIDSYLDTLSQGVQSIDIANKVREIEELEDRIDEMPEIPTEPFDDMETAVIAVVNQLDVMNEKLATAYDELEDLSFDQDINLFGDTIDQAQQLIEAIDDVAEATQLVDENLQVNPDNLMSLVSIYPDILDSATVTADGMIQLDQAVYDSSVGLAKAKIGETAEETAARLEAEAEYAQAKSDMYAKEAETLKTALENEVITSQTADDLIGQSEKNLSDYQTDLYADVDAAALTAEQNKSNYSAESANEMALSMLQGTALATGYLGKLDESAYNTLKNIGMNAYQAAKAVGSIGTDAPYIPVFSQGGGGLIFGSYVDIGSGGAITAGESINASDAVKSGSDPEAVSRIQAKYEEYLAKSEAYNEISGMLKGYALTARSKALTAGNNQMGSGGSGGGGGYTPKQKEYTENEIDRYQKVNAELDDIAGNLERIGNEEDRLSGIDLSENIADQIDLTKDQIHWLEEKKKIQEAERDEYKKELEEVYLIEFDENGFIQNYAEVYNKLLSNLNGLKDQYNSATSEAEQEALEEAITLAEEALDNYSDTIEKYDELQHTEIQNTENEIEGLYDFIEDKQIDLFNKSLDAIGNLQELNEKMAEFDGIMTGLGSKDPMRNLVQSMSDISSYLNDNIKGEWLTKVAEIQEERRIFEETGSSPTFGENEAALAEAEAKILEESIAAIVEEESKMQELQESILDVMDDQSERMEQRIEQYDRLGSELEHQKSLIELIRGEEAYDDLNNVNDALAANNQAKIAEYASQLKYWQDIANSYTDKNSDAYKEAMEHVYEAQEEIDGLVEDSLSIYQEMFENSINKTVDAFSNKLAGTDDYEWMQEEWELINRNSEQYLDNVNSAYEIQKLQGRYVQMLDEATDPGIQKEITKQMNEQLKLLREKDKLSQYDVEYANAQLEILQKRIALEDAQRNKNQMRLKRDAQGNYSYVYTADENKIAAAQQELADAQNNAYNLSKQNIIDVYGDALSQIADANSMIKGIMSTVGLDADTKDQRVKTIYDGLMTYLKNAGNMLSTSESNVVNDLIDLVGGISKDNIGENLQNVVSQLLGGNSGAMQNIDPRFNTAFSKTLQGIENVVYEESELFIGLTDAQNAWETRTKETMASAGDSFDDFGSKVSEARDAMGELRDNSEDFYKTIADEGETLKTAQKQVDDYTASLDAMKEKYTEIYDLFDQRRSTIKEEMSLNDSIGVNIEGMDGVSENTAAIAKLTQELVDGSFSINIRSEQFAELAKEIQGKINSLDQVNINPDKFDTGGYTGSWSDGSGKLAMLHSKELVLNAHDTANILKTVDMVREMTNAMKIDAFGMMPGSMLGGVNKTSGNDNDVNVNITAEFPNAYSASEIKTAIMDLNEQAIQHVYKNR